jgi:hypothetical protein
MLLYDPARYDYVSHDGAMNDQCVVRTQILTFITIMMWGFGMSYSSFHFGREASKLSPFQDEKSMPVQCLRCVFLTT